MNPVWTIIFGDYALHVDRRALRFSLRDTKTGTHWAADLSLGWVELEDRATGERTRYDFGQTQIVSVAEKAGPNGKRILFGLDAPGGIPIDVYVICTEREIQLTVEANRDSPTHRVMGFGLVPGLVSVPDDGASYLVVPSGAGIGILARDVFESRLRKGIPQYHRFRIWQEVYMPFIGAVRAQTGASGVADAPAGSLALITDSAYGLFRLKRQENGSATLDLEYKRDPERRRLDARVVVLPGENHVGVARAYRDKIIGENNHVTLRRKIRERPVVEGLIGAAWWVNKKDRPEVTPGVGKNNTGLWDSDAATRRVALRPIENVTFPPHNTMETIAVHSTTGSIRYAENRWEAIEQKLLHINEARQKGSAVAVGIAGAGDWEAIASDFVHLMWGGVWGSLRLPLLPVVYHDCLAMPAPLQWLETEDGMKHFFLPALLALTTGFLPRPGMGNQALLPKSPAAYAILSPLHKLTFSAFLTAHRFLTPDALVEEAEYSDKTRIVINRSDVNDYETNDLHLPPGGFYVRHAQMEAHDALRVGQETFSPRAWRVFRSQDGLPLEQSGDVLRQVFPV